MTGPNPSQQWLRNLPLAEPPGHLWTRILETRLGEERLRRRRLLWIGGLANAALLVVLATAWLVSDPPAPTQDSLETLIARSQVLEERLLAYEDRFAGLQASQRELAEQQQAQLIALDQSLAQAYAQGRPIAQLNELWRRRAGLVSALLVLYETPQTIAEGI